jgi:hypothetical protein
MPSHHPHTAPDRPTAGQQRYLRRLAEQTGTSFTPPATRAQASREIRRLEGLQRSPRADQLRDRKTVQADVQGGAGDSVRHQAGETRGFGSSARWAHGTREAKR